MTLQEEGLRGDEEDKGMAKGEAKITNKERERLRWEYLKRSINCQEWREYCEWKKQKRENPRLTQLKKFPQRFEIIYSIYGDIFSSSFDEWYTPAEKIRSKSELGRQIGPKEFEKFIDALQSPKKRRIIRSPRTDKVREYSKERINFDWEIALSNFRKVNGKDPSVSEFKEKFIQHISSSPTRFFLEINLGIDEKIKDLLSQFHKLIKQKTEDPVIQELLQFYKRWLYPTSPVRPELKKYLEIYDENHPISGGKGLTVPQIAEKHYSGKDGGENVLNPEQNVREILGKVRRIIENVEKGIFPGEYDKTKQKKQKKKKMPEK